MTITIETIQATLDNIERLLAGMPSAQRVSGQQVTVVEGLSDISESLGLIKAGEFRSGTGDPGFGFTGVRMGSPGWNYQTYGSQQFAIVGVRDDVVQFGMSNTTGAIYAGEGSVTIDGAGISIISSADDFSVQPTWFNFLFDEGGILRTIGNITGSYTGGESASLALINYTTYQSPWIRSNTKLWSLTRNEGDSVYTTQSSFEVNTLGEASMYARTTISMRSDTYTGLSAGSFIDLNASTSITLYANTDVNITSVNNTAITANANLSISGKLLTITDDLAKIVPSNRTDLTAEFDAMGLWVTDTTRTFATGNRVQMAHAAISKPNWSAASASTITTRSATLFIDGAPTLTNYTAARNYAVDIRGGLWLEDGGLNLANGISAGDGSMSYSGDLMAYRNSTNYTGYIYVPLTTPLTAAAWTSSARSTTARTLIDLSAVFGVPDGVRAVCVRTTIRDSGSATNDCSIAFASASGATPLAMTTRCSGLANDSWTNGWGIVPCDANGDIYYQIAASGANTLDVTMDIAGYFF